MSEFKDNSARSRFELSRDGHVAFADYALSGQTLTIRYVEAPPALRGTGAAGELMQHIADKAKAEHLNIVPICGYAAAWLRKHKIG